jgi:ADP-ribose pyrophosphatase YjhB (NUDIX family)
MSASRSDDAAADDPPPLSQEEFDTIYAKVPRLTVEVVIRSPDGVLLTRRQSGPCRGLWHVPGGTVRLGEPLTDAVVRVARQELGLDVVAGALIGYIEYPSHLQRGLGWPVGVAFRARIASGARQFRRQPGLADWFSLLPAEMHEEQGAFLAAHELADLRKRGRHGPGTPGAKGQAPMEAENDRGDLPEGELRARGWIEGPEGEPGEGTFGTGRCETPDYGVTCLLFLPDSGARLRRIPWFHVNQVLVWTLAELDSEVADDHSSILQGSGEATALLGGMSGGSRHWLGYYQFGLIAVRPSTNADWIAQFRQNDVDLYDER